MLRSLTILLFVFLDVHTYAQLKQEVKISNVSIIPRINNEGATSMQVNYALNFKYSRQDKLNAKDSSDNHYLIEIRLETDSGRVLAQQGYEQNIDSAGTLVFRNEVLLNIDRYYAGNAIFLPIASLRLDTGTYRIRAVMRCYDYNHLQVTDDLRSGFTVFRMPQHQAVKLMMRHISVSHTDHSGEPWDYYPFNYHKSLPDVFWELHYGTAPLHTSTTQWDTYEWEDQYGAGDYTFYIIKGDVLRMRIYDRDVYSPNDLIGSTYISMGPKCCDAKLHDIKFDYVLNMVYAISEDVNATIEYTPVTPTDSIIQK